MRQINELKKSSPYQEALLINRLLIINSKRSKDKPLGRSSADLSILATLSYLLAVRS